MVRLHHTHIHNPAIKNDPQQCLTPYQSVYTGVELEDDVFCGLSCVFTNVLNPRAQIVRHHKYARPLVRRGATIGANATIVCGARLGAMLLLARGRWCEGMYRTMPSCWGFLLCKKGCLDWPEDQPLP